MSSSHVDTAAYQTETYDDEDDSFEVESDFFSNESSSEESSDDDSIDAENKKVDDETADLLSVARRDTAHVQRWRTVVLTMIVVTGVILTTGTFLVLRNEQFDDSIDRYLQYTGTAKQQLSHNFDTLNKNLRSLADEISETAEILGDRFPFSTSTLFELKASRTRERTGIEFVAYAPFVDVSQRRQWVQYTQANSAWHERSIAEQNKHEDDGHHHGEHRRANVFDQNDPAGSVTPYIWKFNETLNGAVVADQQGLYAPLWHTSPPPSSLSAVNLDLFAVDFVRRIAPIVNATEESLLSETSTELQDFIGVGFGFTNSEDEHLAHTGSESRTSPHFAILVPVYEPSTTDNSHSMAGIVIGMLPWDLLLDELFPEDTRGIYVVVKNSCGQSYTYFVQDGMINFIGQGDLHDRNFDFTETQIPLVKSFDSSDNRFRLSCIYYIHTYSSKDFHEQTWSELPMVFAIAVSLVFISTMLIFCMYDCFVRRRNEKVVNVAAQSNAIISSLFPTNVRDRLFQEAKEKRKQTKYGKVPKSSLQSMLKSGKLNDNAADEDDDDDFMYKSKPIADLFPETTIIFADIAGFTAWSSVREPSQVFILLETIYRAFDQIARQRRIFKVETVGDCYVAVAGLPDPRRDHAIAMCRFAKECMLKTRVLVRKLEVTLGPDTGDLAMRMGIHSGPVTAGVLRGERSRFQLFGDTMNTAARMEHTGIRDKIQLSQATTDLLLAGGKSSWVVPREELVHAKGKGELKTYWLELSRDGANLDTSSHHGGSTNQSRDDDISEKNDAFDGKTLRLIEWNVDVLTRLLKQIVSHRRACPPSSQEAAEQPNETVFSSEVRRISSIDEVKEIVELPKFKETRAAEEDPESIVLDEEVYDQLYDYVCNIAALYRDNPFHNFEHASHVSMSVVKLLSRIVAPHDYMASSKHVESSLHDHTYGITSDPLTQFACVFSALIHDAAHAGVSNAQLVKEKAAVAVQYNRKSVLEQNSIDLAWNMLMERDYSKLRAVIYETNSELKRFRQLAVNAVMATDIVDKELKTLRNLRWDRAFAQATRGFNDENTVNRKATVVIEHLIQASDVAHTMQHWHIYRKWNERFFKECYAAYKDGRADTDPSVGWYQGEIGFFDFYIIPLARKLKECGVFGVSSDEYLNYAVNNRQEWQARGKEIVDEMIEKVKVAFP